MAKKGHLSHEIINPKGVAVLSEVVATVGTIGEDETIKALQEARKDKAEHHKEKSVDTSKELFNYACKVLYQETKVTLARLQLRIGKSNEEEDVYFAVAWFCNALQHYCSWSKQEVRDFLNKSRTTVFSYEKYLSSLHPRINEKFVKKASKMDEQMREYYAKLTTH